MIRRPPKVGVGPHGEILVDDGPREIIVIQVCGA